MMIKVKGVEVSIKDIYEVTDAEKEELKEALKEDKNMQDRLIEDMTKEEDYYTHEALEYLRDGIDGASIGPYRSWVTVKDAANFIKGMEHLNEDMPIGHDTQLVLQDALKISEVYRDIYTGADYFDTIEKALEEAAEQLAIDYAYELTERYNAISEISEMLYRIDFYHEERNPIYFARFDSSIMLFTDSDIDGFPLMELKDYID